MIVGLEMPGACILTHSPRRNKKVKVGRLTPQNSSCPHFDLKMVGKVVLLLLVFVPKPRLGSAVRFVEENDHD